MLVPGNLRFLIIPGEIYMKLKSFVSLSAVCCLFICSLAANANPLLSSTANSIAVQTPSTLQNAATDKLRTQVASTGQKKSTEKVNINNADISQLTTLKGIGEKKAQAILDYRTQHGSFKTLADLGNIKGFTPKFMDNLQKNNLDRIVLQ